MPDKIEELGAGGHIPANPCHDISLCHLTLVATARHEICAVCDGMTGAFAIARHER